MHHECQAHHASAQTSEEESMVGFFMSRPMQHESDRHAVKMHELQSIKTNTRKALQGEGSDKVLFAKIKPQSGAYKKTQTPYKEEDITCKST